MTTILLCLVAPSLIFGWFGLAFLATNYGAQPHPHALTYYVIGRLMTIIGVFAIATNVWAMIEHFVD